jgi:peptidyl-prolyl cis-trans isomerase D
MIAQVTLDEQARKMQLGLSNEDIASRIRTDPTFRGPTGQFDRARFEQAIRDNGFTEARFVAEQRNTMLRRQIAQSVAGDVVVPNAAITALNQFQNEKRDIDYVVLGPAQAGNVPSPMPDEIQTYYDEHKALFRAPEYRKLTLLVLSAAELAKPADVKDADAKAYFEQRKDQYGKPEKRDVHQLVFPDEAQAQAAKQEIAGGATFEQIGEKRGLKASDIDLGLITKSQIVDPAIANAAFSLPEGAVSDPIKGRFGTVLIKVTKIEPGEQVTYEQVAPQIKQTLAEQNARGAVNTLRDKVEDERASGATLEETAKKLGLKSVTIDAVDRAGRTPDGQPATALKDVPPSLISSAFATDVGVDSEPVQLPAGGFVYFDVNGITPSHDRPIAEVRPEVEARWRAEQIGKKLADDAKQMLDKLKGGAQFAQVASEHGVNVQNAAGLQRGKSAGFVPSSVSDAAFKTAKGAFAEVEGANPTERYVFQVTNLTDPPTDAPQAAQLKTVLQNSYAEDLVGEYIIRLESEFGVKRNEAALNQVVGGTTEQ